MVAVIGMCLGVAVPAMQSLEERRFRWVREQEYDHSCGVSAVSSLVAFYWNLDVSEGDLITIVENNTAENDGEISLLDLSKLLSSLEFSTRGFRVTYEVLLEAAERYGPLIVHLNEGAGHFVLVIGESAGQPIVGDPSDGAAVWPVRTFARSWSGTALVASLSGSVLDRSAVAAAVGDLQHRQAVLIKWGTR
jgi:ABC-type bacteriocin/lantibiotic exporter with double-glycine peptidase domain